MLLHWIYQVGYESVDNNNLNSLFGLVVTVDFDNPVDPVVLFDSDDIRKTIHSTFS